MLSSDSLSVRSRRRGSTDTPQSTSAETQKNVWSPTSDYMCVNHNYFCFFLRIVNDNDLVQERLMITTQIVRDEVYARQLHYEEENHTPEEVEPDLDTLRQIVRDSVLARQLSRCEELIPDI